MNEFIKTHIVEDRKSPSDGPVSAKRNIVMQLENKVSRLEDQLTYLTEYEDKLAEELADIQRQGSDKRTADQETIERLRLQLEKANLVLANLIQLDRMSDSEQDENEVE